MLFCINPLQLIINSFVNPVFYHATELMWNYILSLIWTSIFAALPAALSRGIHLSTVRMQSH